MKKLLLIALLGCVGFLPAQAQTTPYHGQKIVGYIPSYGDMSIVDFTKLTHAMFAFIVPTTTGGIYAQNSWELSKQADFFTRANAAGTVKKFICLGSTNFATMANSSAARTAFADTLLKFVQHYGYDGVDVDWEGLSNATHRSDFTLIMQELSAKLKPAGIELSVTIGFGNYWGQWYSDEGLAEADWMQIMVYDQTGTWPASPFGNHSSYQHLLDAETYWVGRGYDRANLVMGLPFYGYTFSSTSGGLGSAKRYSEILAIWPNMSDNDNLAPDGLTWFNGPALIRQKCQYLIDNEFGGVMVWEMTQDATGDFSLHKQIICTYEGTTCYEKVVTSTLASEESGFDCHLTNNTTLHVNSQLSGEAVFTFYSADGRILSAPLQVNLDSGETDYTLPAEINSFTIVKATVNGNVFSKKLTPVK